MRYTVPASLALASLLAATGALAQGASPFSAARLVARSDSFVVLVQGTPRGFARETIERTADGFRLTSRQEMGGMMSQSTEVAFSPALEMRSVKQTGQARGAEMKIDVTYADGRAKGAAPTPGPQGMQTLAVDTVVPPGSIDDNLLMALLPTLELRPGAEYRVAVFASGKGEAQEVTLKVGAAESVSVPAGTFDAHPVLMSGGPVPVTFYVSAGAASRVVRLTMAGVPMEYQLVK
jgi:hypothetical protein